MTQHDRDSYVYVIHIIGGWGYCPAGKSFWFLCVRHSEAGSLFAKSRWRARGRAPVGRHRPLVSTVVVLVAVALLELLARLALLLLLLPLGR